MGRITREDGEHWARWWRYAEELHRHARARFSPYDSQLPDPAQLGACPTVTIPIDRVLRFRADYAEFAALLSEILGCDVMPMSHLELFERVAQHIADDRRLRSNDG